MTTEEITCDIEFGGFYNDDATFLVQYEWDRGELTGFEIMQIRMGFGWLTAHQLQDFMGRDAFARFTDILRTQVVETGQPNYRQDDFADECRADRMSAV